jgi:mono/diheme cytochrome c family protein
MHRMDDRSVVRSMTRALVGAVILSLATCAAGAQESGDTERGRALATRICAECHAILQGAAKSPAPGVATFEVIANTPGMTAMALSVWLTTPHRKMPNLILSTQERDDVIAYITSLRR